VRDDVTKLNIYITITVPEITGNLHQISPLYSQRNADDKTTEQYKNRKQADRQIARIHRLKLIDVNAARVRTPMFDLKGSINMLDPPIIPTQ